MDNLRVQIDLLETKYRHQGKSVSLREKVEYVISHLKYNSQRIQIKTDLNCIPHITISGGKGYEETVRGLAEKISDKLSQAALYDPSFRKPIVLHK